MLTEAGYFEFLAFYQITSQISYWQLTIETGTAISVCTFFWGQKLILNSIIQGYYFSIQFFTLGYN